MGVKDILQECIDENISVKDWNDKAEEKLSLQLAGKYDFQMVNLLETDFLLLFPESENTLPVLEHDGARIETACEMPAAFYFDHISSFRKKNLLKKRIAFIDSDKEVYLPFIALRMKLQIQKKNTGQYAESGVPFTPGAQLVFLYLLYRPEREYTMSQLATELGISVMTAQRSLQVLYEKGLVKVKTAGKTGREKRYTRIDQISFYHKGKSFLANPLASEIFVTKIPREVRYLKSDLTALGEQTMLGTSEQKTAAIPMFEKKYLEKFLITDRDEIAETKCIRVQVMKYNILSLTDTEYVDPITLILSLSERDERIDQTIDELMEGKSWYQE